MNKFLQLLGLAMRAGKVVSGEELVIREIRSGKAQLVILAEDAAKKTRKKRSVTNVNLTTFLCCDSGYPKRVGKCDWKRDTRGHCNHGPGVCPVIHEARQ